MIWSGTIAPFCRHLILSWLLTKFLCQTDDLSEQIVIIYGARMSDKILTR